MIDEEAFEAWRDNPVTRWVMGACQKAAQENKDAWLANSWGTGIADQLALTELRTRADAYMALAETDFIGWQKTHGEDDAQ